MLRIRSLKQFFWYSDPPMKRDPHDIVYCREHVLRDEVMSHLADACTILSSRLLLEEHDQRSQIQATVYAKLIEHGLLLNTGSALDPTLFAAPSTIDNNWERDCKMLQTKRCVQWCFAVMANIGKDADSDLVYAQHRPL